MMLIVQILVVTISYVSHFWLFYVPQPVQPIFDHWPLRSMLVIGYLVICVDKQLNIWLNKAVRECIYRYMLYNILIAVKQNQTTY